VSHRVYTSLGDDELRDDSGARLSDVAAATIASAIDVPARTHSAPALTK
jgi:hypothetical protein